MRNKIFKIKILKALFYFLILIAFLILLAPKNAFAICPVCTVAIAGGVGLSRYLGIDDTISGLWIGALIVSLILTTESFLDKKQIKFRGRLILNILFYYALAILPLYFYKIIGHPQNILFCYCSFKVDKLIFGIIIGTLAFVLSSRLHFFIKQKRKKILFPFQKVILPILILLALSLVFYFLTK